ncbi:lipoprotein antigen [Mycolicibacterium hassiacum DSM 44199]|uniref:Lipoprotein antigen n=1 Tax=Mycolicibacterium hassiacum (strain DSM 44199 / CIP 105218 / JCM 12690 / 3849) TaxID=1122247 RepID=K5BDB1_MYCHD|nr:lipoprotein LpqH [Mycolicibacterium hassiacum]EKF21356.1 lipoprotein antigen [Mycolicibacterium hassiacum DSM 44199]MDA4088640.1 hypothetical protein [Mycolicibacterium hassiacum DSM 44199]VCT90180.1 putative lipoprotein LppE [Mycolicibacterium hassiacum DSM 44199]
MGKRFVAAAAVGLAAAATGCSTNPPALGGTTAKVTVNGRSTGGPYPVTCIQTGWLWTIKTYDDQAQGFTASIEAGDEVTVQAVELRDLGGFTGTFWRDNLGEAEVSSAGGTYTITGTADGSFADNPNETVSTPFGIEATC